MSLLARLIDNLKNPLVILLSSLGLLSYLTGDVRATVVIMVMVLLGVVLRFFQEVRADNAAEKLKAMIHTTATVIRGGNETEVALKMLVPGDVIKLSAGDMVPGDVRLLATKDLFVNQAALTGESVAVEKLAAPGPVPAQNPFERTDVCLLGSNVESGFGKAVVVSTGDPTYFGSLATSIAGQRVLTSFDKGINSFTWLMIRFIGVMVPTVFLINGLSRHSWLEAFLFAVAVAVGLTPEMLPMIVTVNLSKGALAMAGKKVIVKRLNAIQNFGAMDVLCTDKTGTITQGKIVLEKHLDVHGNDSKRVLDCGFLNSFYQTGLKNLMDEAILDHAHLEGELQVKEEYRKIDEIPFDFVRRRMSVILEDSQVLTNNLLYDFSQTTIPTDVVDAEWLTKPRKWAIDDIQRFILFIGPISSIFDYITFFVMLNIFDCWHNPELFHTGWFIESLFTQTLIIHIIRTNKIPFVESWASKPLIATSLIIVSIGIWLTVSPLAQTLGFVPLPPLYWPILAAILLSYVMLT
jgi:P-type Mg2+ transporter